MLSKHFYDIALHRDSHAKCQQNTQYTRYEHQKPTPLRSSKGKAMNKTREGKTSQKIPCDKAETFCISDVSI